MSFAEFLLAYGLVLLSLVVFLLSEATDYLQIIAKFEHESVTDELVHAIRGYACHYLPLTTLFAIGLAGWFLT